MGKILSRLWAKVHEVSRRCRRPLVLVVSDVLVRLSISCFLPKLFATRSRRLRKNDQMYSRRKQVVLGPRFAGGGHTPYIGHIFSNRTYVRACVRFWLSPLCDATLMPIRGCAMDWDGTKYWGWVKTPRCGFKAFVYQSSWNIAAT